MRAQVNRLAVVAVALVGAGMFFITTASAATIQATYQARYGSHGTITVRQFTDGTGSAIIHMYALAPGRTYTFFLASGRCTGSITPLVPARSLKVSSAGSMGQTRLLSSSQMRTIAPRLVSANVVAVLTAGASRLCRTLYVPSALAPSPSPSGAPSPTPTPTPSATATPTPGITANVTAHRFGYGPLLTPSSMTNWFPALKVGVKASATADVTAGQNVYALFVIPPGGSLTFEVTSSSSSGGWYWQWNPANNYWNTPELYFFDGQFLTLNGGTTWAFGLAYNTYAGSETLMITPTAITRP
jgi:hypothetical protein